MSLTQAFSAAFVPSLLSITSFPHLRYLDTAYSRFLLEFLSNSEYSDLLFWILVSSSLCTA